MMKMTNDTIIDITQTSPNSATKSINYAYNLTSQITSVNRNESNTLIANTNYTYDGIGRLTQITHERLGTVLAEFGLTLDAASRIVGINDADYDYDSTGQLTGATYEDQQPDESYAYDENGNRADYVIGANNQILSDGTYNYTYDNEGNRASRTNIITNETTTYEWDNRNRLVSVTTNKLTVNYAYDYLNRLVSRTVIQNGQQISKENFIHDGDQIVLEFSNNQLAQRNLWGVAVDELLATDYLLDDDTLWALANHQNSITNILQNNNGQVIDIAEIDYDAFGNIVEGHNPLHYGYTGKYHDNITNLQWNINRWYDSTTGQWISEDPISFGGGDANLYRYVGNAVLDFVDADGLMIIFPSVYPALVETPGNQVFVQANDSYKITWRGQWTEAEKQKIYSSLDLVKERLPKMIADIDEAKNKMKPDDYILFALDNSFF
jgi:RHS repeat-associated protein